MAFTENRKEVIRNLLRHVPDLLNYIENRIAMTFKIVARLAVFQQHVLVVVWFGRCFVKVPFECAIEVVSEVIHGDSLALHAAVITDGALASLLDLRSKENLICALAADQLLLNRGLALLRCHQFSSSDYQLSKCADYCSPSDRQKNCATIR